MRGAPRPRLDANAHEAARLEQRVFRRVHDQQRPPGVRLRPLQDGERPLDGPRGDRVPLGPRPRRRSRLELEPAMMLFLHGATSMGCIVAALYFLRFWRDTRDRLFVLFSIAFAVLAANRAALAL